jgi:hypothetical protein
MHMRQIAIRGAGLTAFYLSGGFLLGFLSASMFFGLPMHLPESTRIILAFVIILLSLTISGGAWGRGMARLIEAGEPRRMTWAGMLSFGPAVILAVLVLGRLERLVVEEGAGPALPVHNVFTILFVPAVFVVVSLVSLVMGLAAGGGRNAWRPALGSGLAGCAAFLVVDLVMDQLGYRVGAPGAAERATMLTVMFAGSLGASLVGGAVLGMLLRQVTLKPVQSKSALPSQAGIQAQVGQE